MDLPPNAAPAGVASILDFAQPVAPPAPARMPSAYYPGPAPGAAGDKRRKALLGARLLLAAAIVLIVLIAYCLFSRRALARGLAACGWFLYLRVGCGWCHKQVGLLPGFDRTATCGGPGGVADLCPLPGHDAPCCSAVKAFPFWVNTRTHETRSGFQDARALRQMAQW